MTTLGMSTSPHHGDNNTGNHPKGDEEGPVTVIVTRRAKIGKIKEFEEWMDGIIHEAMKFEGHMGVNVIKPFSISNPEYVIIFRFNTYQNLKKWETSEIRKDWLKKSKHVTEGETRTEVQTGLEFWFTPHSINASDDSLIIPPRYKMAIVTSGIVFALLSTLIPQIRQMTADLPIFLSTLIGVLIMVLLMTYGIMPTVTRILRPWLYKKRIF